MKESAIPITEQSNIITQDIDRGNTEEIVEVLHKCDLEIFNGWGGYQNVLSSQFLAKLHELSTLAAPYVKPDAQNAGIILSGCGTSGRLAFLISRMFNKLAERQKLRPCYRYVISGGDHALMTSVESCEDDWNAGKKELENAAKGLVKVLYVGITCGLSAPFVGGQVEYCLQHPQRFTPYLLGFNPTDQARNAAISGTDKVMFDIAFEMEGEVTVFILLVMVVSIKTVTNLLRIFVSFVAKSCLLNPVVGPEPITGSSRMKGGTVTKMLLEAIFFTAHQLAVNDPTPIACEDIIKAYQTTLESTHTKDAEISLLIKVAGNSLVKGGSVLYVGWGSLGIMGMIDAAECVPTFGANHDDVRCFLKSGYEILNNTHGDLSSQGDKLEIGFDYFIEKRCPTLSKNDTVIFIVRDLASEQKQELGRIAELVKSRKASLAIIAISTNDSNLQLQDILGNILTIHIVLPSISKEESSNIQYKFLDQSTAEVSLKWVINAVSTGAHILKGKVFKNCMIDLKLTNEKLFERGVRIVTQFSNVTSEEAKECLLKSIYRQDVLNRRIVEAKVPEHVKRAGYVERVVPLAILLTKGFKVSAGLQMLEGCPIVRQCIDNCL